VKEQSMLNRLKQGDVEAFSAIFRHFYTDLVLFAGTYLPDRIACEDIVQSIFLKLWNERNSLIIEVSLKSYLLKAVRNSCLDEIRHRNVIIEHESYSLLHEAQMGMDTEEYILHSDLQEHLQKALVDMPETYRTAFEMNRFEGLKYREIAEKLKVSERTVEVRISKAIELLRKHLKHFLALAIFFGFH